MAIGDQARALGLAQQLVPNYADQQLERQLRAAQIGGIQADNQLRAVQAQAGQAELDNDAAYQRALLDPRAQTLDGKLEILRRFPRQAKSNMEVLKAELSEADKAQFTRAGEAANLAMRGDYDAAAKRVEAQIAADRAAGTVDEDDQQLLTMLRSGDPEQQRKATEYMTRAAALSSGTEHAAALLNALKPDLMGVAPGTVVIDPATGETRFESPYKPQLVTQTNPDGSTTTFEYTPAREGGDQSTGGGDPVASLQQAIPGLTITSGKRTPERNRAVHGVPNSRHLDGGALDLVPPSGMSMTELATRVKRQHPGAKVLNEGDHVHAEFPGWNGAPNISGGRGRVVASSAAPPKKPSETRVVQGRTYYKVDGRWYDNPEGT